MKENKVEYHAKSIFDININFFKNLGIKYIVSDLDNTLDQFNIMKPSSRVIALNEELKANGISLVIVSNNTEKRVKPYADLLNTIYLFSAKKPFGKRLDDFLKLNCIDKKETIMIGDQLLTDAKTAKNVGLPFILTDPISKKEQWTTHFNRIIDRPLRKKYRKNKQLGFECDKRKEELV